MAVSWKQLLADACTETGENIADLKIEVSGGNIDQAFLANSGAKHGAAFTAWGPKFVYMPVAIRRSVTSEGFQETVGYVPRNPEPGKPYFSAHLGGE